jgi:hypothetical protein
MVSSVKNLKPAPPAERIHYTVSGGKRMGYAFAILVLAPFFVSLPMMLYQRIAHGLWVDTWQLLIVALGFSIFLGLLGLALIHALRARVALGERSFTFTLPYRGGPTPLLRYDRQTIAYADIAEIELRREVFGGAFLPVELVGAHVITKKGIDIPLGYVSDLCPDRSLPFADIASELAGRAGVPLVEEPGVWRTLRSKAQAAAHGLIAGDAHLMQPEEVEKLNRNHRRLSLAVVNIVVAIVLVGVATDLAG